MNGSLCKGSCKPVTQFDKFSKTLRTRTESFINGMQLAVIGWRKYIKVIPCIFAPFRHLLKCSCFREDDRCCHCGKENRCMYYCNRTLEEC